MTAPVVRASVFRNVAGEVEIIVTIDGAQVRGVLRDDDAMRLARELARIANVAVFQQPGEVGK